jgi:hypothetical protein
MSGDHGSSERRLFNLWQWNGSYFGYRLNDQLFTRSGRCVGVFRGDEVYGHRGQYLGEIKSRDRLITNTEKLDKRGPAAPDVMGEPAPEVSKRPEYAMYVAHEAFPPLSSFK